MGEITNEEDKYIRPKAAESKMKAAEGLNHTIWINGVSGSGKTSFANSYLKRKKHEYYSAKNIMPEQIDTHVKGDKKRIVVIDDLYGIVEDELQNVWFQKIDEMIQENKLWLIIISRSDVPSWLHSLAVQYYFYHIDEHDLYMNEAQTRQYFAMWELEMKESMFKPIWKLGGGYPLWNRICAIEFARLGLERNGFVGEDNVKRLIDKATESMWKYLNSYVFDQWDSQFCELMMFLSVFNEFDLDMAVYLTGNSNVNYLLTQAVDLDNFLKEKNGIWHIRTTMRNSMIQRLEKNMTLTLLTVCMSGPGTA